MHDTVLGRLALQFSSRPENLATEALAYLLESPVATDVIRRRLGPPDLELPNGLRFATQVLGQEGEIPDVVGTDSVGVAHVVLEAKYWAGLTANQPVTYLRGVAGVAPRLLTFVVPRLRFETIWPELLRRCRTGSVDMVTTTDVGEIRFAVTRSGTVLEMVSWAHLLGLIGAAFDAAGEASLAADTQQLQGLCRRMDTAAPLPFDSGFLTNELPALRYLQLLRLVNETTDRAVATGIASVKGLRAAASSTWNGRYLMLGQTAVRLGVDLDLWSRFATSPIWLSLSGSRWADDGRAVRTKLRLIPWLAAEPSRRDSLGKEAVPLFAPSGMEWPHVVDAMYAQLVDVHRSLGDLPPPTNGVLPPPEAALDGSP